MFSYFNKEGYYKTEPANAKPIKNCGAALNVTKLNWLGIPKGMPSMCCLMKPCCIQLLLLLKQLILEIQVKPPMTHLGTLKKTDFYNALKCWQFTFLAWSNQLIIAVWQVHKVQYCKMWIYSVHIWDSLIESIPRSFGLLTCINYIFLACD